MKRPLVMILFLAGLAAWSSAGCDQTKEVNYLAPQRLERGLVFSLDGVGGYNWGPRWLRSGLDQAGVGYAIKIFDWGHGPAGLFVADLWDEKGNRRRAAELNQLIERYQRLFPGRPVFLIGHSGGAGMVVFALEQMKPEMQVDSVFLLAPALDPSHNLAPALRHVRDRCYATYSKGDLGLMGLGTSVFTTMDGKHTVGAGMLGFKLPRNLGPTEVDEYFKLRQAQWGPDMMKEGHLGGHMGWTTTTFARDFIAPVLTGREPDSAFKPLLDAPHSGPREKGLRPAAADRSGKSPAATRSSAPPDQVPAARRSKP